MKRRNLLGGAVLIAAVVGVTAWRMSASAGEVEGSNPFAKWEYPKAKRGYFLVSNTPLAHATYTTTDPIEEVWDFYWRKAIPLSIKRPSWDKPSGSIEVIRGPREETHNSFVQLPTKAGRFGVFVLRTAKQTLSVYLFRGAREKTTHIGLILDER